MSNDPEVVKQERRVDKTLDRMMEAHIKREKAWEDVKKEIGDDAAPRGRVCPSCFVREPKPHRVGCEIDRNAGARSPTRRTVVPGSGEPLPPAPPAIEIPKLMEMIEGQNAIIQKQQAMIEQLLAANKAGDNGAAPLTVKESDDD